MHLPLPTVLYKFFYNFKVYKYLEDKFNNVSKHIDKKLNP